MKKNYLLKISLLFLCMALVAGIYTFGVIPSVKRSEQKKYEEKLTEITGTYVAVPIYNGETKLTKGTVITEALKDLFTVMELPQSCLNENMITDPEMVYGMELKGTLCRGEPLTYDNLGKAEFTENEFERLKEFEISGDVCGKVTSGVYIDVTVRYGNGDYDVVLAKKRVYDIAETGKNGMYTVVLAVNEEEYGNMLEAGKVGTLDTRVYTDENHPASSVTFGVTPK